MEEEVEGRNSLMDHRPLEVEAVVVLEELEARNHTLRQEGRVNMEAAVVGWELMERAVESDPVLLSSRGNGGIQL